MKGCPVERSKMKRLLVPFAVVAFFLLTLAVAPGCQADNEAVARMHFQTGVEASKAGRYEDAITSYSLAIKRNPNLIDA